MYFDGYKLSHRAELAARGIPFEPAAAPMTIAASAVAEANAGKLKPSPLAMDAKAIYTPYQFPAGIYPEGMAMDATITDTANTIASWAASGMFHEGQGFFGFPYLAELAQRAEYRHACDIWAEHAVRKWIKFTGSTEEKQKAIEAEFKRLNVRDVIEEWLGHDQIFGRGQIFLDFGDADNWNELQTELLLKPEKISKKRPLKRINTVEPLWSAPGTYATDNPLKPDFYRPRAWFVYGRTVHTSRMMTIASRPVSDMLKPSYAFGGLSLIQVMKPYVDNWLRTRQGVSDMVATYSTMVLSTDMETVLSGGTSQTLMLRADLFNQTRDNRGLMLVDKDGETLTNVAVPLSGLHELQAQAQEQLASVSRIPLSIYLQITPTGLNATNDGETRNFYADVHSYQEKSVRPHLSRLLQIVQLSLFDEIDPELDFEFLPLWEMTDKDKADIRKTDADADVNYVNAGIISPEEVRERLANDETSMYHGVDLSGPPPEIPDMNGELDDGDKPEQLGDDD